jgi:hypothetical protein
LDDGYLRYNSCLEPRKNSVAPISFGCYTRDSRMTSKQCDSASCDSWKYRCLGSNRKLTYYCFNRYCPLGIQTAGALNHLVHSYLMEESWKRKRVHTDAAFVSLQEYSLIYIFEDLELILVFSNHFEQSKINHQLIEH